MYSKCRKKKTKYTREHTHTSTELTIVCIRSEHLTEECLHFRCYFYCILCCSSYHTDHISLLRWYMLFGFYFFSSLRTVHWKTKYSISTIIKAFIFSFVIKINMNISFGFASFSFFFGLLRLARFIYFECSCSNKITMQRCTI